MDFFSFVTTWFWYLMAFGAGMLVAWLVARQFVPATDPDDAIETALSKRPFGPADDDDRAVADERAEVAR